MKRRVFPTIWIISLIALFLFGCSRLFQRRLLSRGGIYYTVKKGDTLNKLSRLYGVPVDDIFVANLLDSRDEIYIGQRIFIPTGGKSAKGEHLSGKEIKSTKTKKAVKKRKKKKWRFFSKKIRHPQLKRKLKKIALKWPLKGVISSGFGVRKNKQRHKGIDIAVKIGTRIKAAAAGKVIYSDDKLRYYGKVIILKNAGNWFTVYAHNSKNLVSEGNWVNQGQLIARAGKTGRATGSHLHFEVRKGRVSVNPLKYLPKR
ncbi:MAG: peptidoglycan DD-metalloendopeptidase family protein [bacterium]